MTEAEEDKEKPAQTHYTCTSNEALEATPGSRKEYIATNILDELHAKQTGTPVSTDSTAAVIQREQAIRRHKRITPKTKL